MTDLNSWLAGIRYVVVGGTATSLYMPLRTTQDIDVLVSSAEAAKAERKLARAGATSLGDLHIDNALRIAGTSWRLPDGTLLNVLRSKRPWVKPALASPVRDAAGLPIIALPFLVLMKLASARGIDIGDLSRMLGGADDRTLHEVRAVVRRFLPDAVEDVDSLAELGRMEFE